MQRIRFSRQEMLFSLKSFAGAMLALYLACRAGLPRPFWAFGVGLGDGMGTGGDRALGVLAAAVASADHEARWES